MNVCVSIAPSSTRDALKKMREAGRETGLVEIRIDGMPRPDLALLLRPPRPRLVITNRRRAEGGRFDGSAAEQLEILSAARRLGADYVDVEASWGRRLVRALAETEGGGRLIVSYHNFERTPGNLDTIYARLRDLAGGGHSVKIATLARDIGDNSALFDLLSRCRAREEKTSAFCMGDRGQISRILGGLFGSEFTYASRSAGERTAPGQISASELKEVFRVPLLNHRTRVFGLAGNPVSQSRGIFYHNAVFRRRRVNAVYVNFLADDFGAFFTTFRPLLSGLSVTMPFKREVIPFLDTIEQDARRIASVNTVVMRRGKAAGYNTDLPALISVLKKRTPLRGKRVLVLGTGATAATMVYAAVESGAAVTVAGRSLQKAGALASQFGCPAATTFDALRAAAADPAGYDIILNGTPVGMHAGPAEKQILPRNSLRRGTIVFDAVYAPADTPLLRSARAAGCTAISGLELFDEQARLQSQLFLKAAR